MLQEENTIFGKSYVNRIRKNRYAVSFAFVVFLTMLAFVSDENDRSN